LKKVIKITLALLVLSFCFGSAVQAQRKKVLFLPKYDSEPYHFGFLLAFNQMIYTIDLADNYQNIEHDPRDWPNGPINPDNVDALYIYNLETQKVPGFTVGIIGNKRLGKYFDLRFIPSLSFGERKMNYTFVTRSSTDGTLEYYPDITKSIFSTFVEFPWQVKYRSKRLNNVAAYVIGGVNPKLDLASQKKNMININVNGTPQTIVNNLITRRFDCALELGTGFDFYNQWFKMGVEVKMSYGLLNIVKEDAFIYTAPIDNLHNKQFQMSFTFE